MEEAPPENSEHRLASRMFGPKATTLLLIAASTLLLLGSLGSRELWTHENRWGVIVQEMIRSGDYFHPYLLGEEYYDKPLPSYWLMAASSRLLGGVIEFSLRLPGALAGLFTVWCAYRLGRRLLGRPAGLLAGWILLTSFFFVFWSRVASSDIYNVAGTIAALAWFFEKRDRPGFLFYTVLYSILAVTCLMKGLIGAAIPFIALLPFPFLFGRASWRSLLRPAAILGMVPALAIYLTPFLLSSAFGGEDFKQSGLWMVFKENVLRYFQPFDHEGSVFTYFGYLPLYLAPWAVFLPFAIWRSAARWKGLAAGERWIALATLAIFAFLTASGSRRGYYILPLLPLAAILLAGWFLAPEGRAIARRNLAAGWAAGTWLLLYIWFAAIPQLSPSQGGLRRLAHDVRPMLEERAPLARWDFVFWKTSPRAAFYLSPAKRPVRLGGPREKCEDQLKPLLAKNPYTVVVTEKDDLAEVTPCVASRVAIEEVSRLPDWAPSWIESDQSKGKRVVLLLPPLAP
jgi:4-amino-4-deoxy-L-arabinose transferase-like glycosyltransferase